MINKIKFRNYKLFKEEQELLLRPITILIGKNSSGKSAITKLLTLIEHSLNHEIDVPLSLENDGVELGAEFKDLVYGRYPGDLEFTLEANNTHLNLKIASGPRSSDIPKIFHWNLNNELVFKYDDTHKIYKDKRTGNNHNIRFNGFNLIFPPGEDPAKNLYEEIGYNLPSKGFTLKTNYIGPYRQIPDRNIKGSLSTIRNNKLGFKGANTYPYLVRDALYNDNQIIRQINLWFQSSFEGWGLKVNTENPPNYELELIRGNPLLEINFRDVGEGMIQCLPLVLSSFLPDDIPELIHVFEQPELHLHPGAHGDLAERFANSTKNTQRRFLIETHSQNFVLRFRRLIAEGKFNKENLIIYFVNFDEEKGESYLEEINVDEKGRVDFWPENIFSETLDETIAIRSAQLKDPYNAS